MVEHEATVDRWQAIQEMFHAALEQPAAERAAFVASRCGADSTLRAEVESLLAAHERTGSFLETAPALPDDHAAVIGTRIGAYEIAARIGEGGMGVVYRAVRSDDAFRKVVAIKIVKRGMDTDFVLRRFRNERQILASLDHLNIARVLDGGSTDDGRPYFVMEHIEGESIHRYCDARRLPIAERLKLFVQVCDAVQFAHRHLVVHRDIKPANILVTRDGTPKLLDFGIAKLLDASAIGGEVETTQTWQRFLTPEYASPEQVRAESVTTATDIYALGLLLYEMLTGRRAHRLQTRSPAELARVVCEEALERPSTAAVSRANPPPATPSGGATPLPEPTPEDLGALRRTTPARLRRALRGDLDTIVLVATRKEPERRYASAQLLQSDVDRHLRGLPISARRESATYRISKLVRRNRLAVTASALAIVGLVAATFVAFSQAHIASAEHEVAERRFSDVRRLARSLLFEIHDAVASLSGSTPARLLIVQRSLEYLDALAAEASGDVPLGVELVHAYLRVGDVQGNSRNANLGDREGASQSYEKALSLARALAVAAPASRLVRKTLAEALDRAGDARWELRDFLRAIEHHRAALAIQEVLAAEAPADRVARRAIADLWSDLGDESRSLGRLGEAEMHYDRALARYREVAALSPDDAPSQRALSIGWNKKGDMLARRGDLAGARAAFEEALRIRERLLARAPESAAAMRDLSVSLAKIAGMHERAADTRAALTAYERCREIDARLAAADPDNAQARRDLAVSLIKTGTMWSALGRRREDALAARKRAWRTARDALAQALGLLRDLERRGGSMPGDRAIAPQVERAIAEADAAIAAKSARAP
jgi:serine/threonine protein kinase